MSNKDWGIELGKWYGFIVHRVDGRQYALIIRVHTIGEDYITGYEEDNIMHIINLNPRMHYGIDIELFGTEPDKETCNRFYKDFMKND